METYIVNLQQYTFFLLLELDANLCIKENFLISL